MDFSEAIKDLVDFEKAKGRICFRLMNKDRDFTACNIYSEFMGDIVKEYFVPMANDEESMMVCRVNDDLMESWGISIYDVQALAEVNTPSLFPVEIRDVAKVIEEGLGITIPEEERHPMLAITNTQLNFGAAAMCYDGILEKASDMMGGCDLIIMPSSKHEVVVAPDSGPEMYPMFAEMVHDTNITKVRPEDYLSDMVLRYVRGKTYGGHIEIVKE